MTRMTDTVIQQTAARWLAQLQDAEVTVDEMLAWQRWMRADARHAAAFERIEEAWDALSEASPGRIEAMSAAAGSSHATHGRRMYAFALAASAAIGAVVLGWILLDRGALPGFTGDSAVVQTTIGENRTQSLADGSTVMLGGDTRVEVRLSRGARQLILTHGEALFIVARDPQRPFTVRAGDATVTATGTAFNVRRSDDRVIVAVMEGRVLVEPAKPAAAMQWLRSAEPPREPVQLDAGQQTTVKHSVVQSAVRLEDPAAATAWRNGLISFQREPLRYVLQDVNRYARKPIVIEDQDVGELRITGTVMDDNVGEWIGSLERAFGLRAVEEPKRIVLKK